MTEALSRAIESEDSVGIKQRVGSQLPMVLYYMNCIECSHLQLLCSTDFSRAEFETPPNFLPRYST